MMEPGFDLALHDALELSLGFRMRPLARLDGRVTLNFRAVREPDGLVFAVKCLPAQKRPSYENTVRQLGALEGSKAVRRLFPGGLAKFRGYDLIFLSWCEGERLFPDRLTDEQADRLVDDYLVFSAALQKTTPSAPTPVFGELWLGARAACRGFWTGAIRRLLETELTEARLRLRPELTRLIHGDFHHGNFLFKDGRVSGFFDFENISPGYPAEDFIRYIVCAAEHLRWYEQGRKRGILRVFRRIVARAPYSAEEWVTAIDRLLMSKVGEKAADRGLGPLMTVNLMFRARFYAVLRRCATEVRAKVEKDLSGGGVT